MGAVTAFALLATTQGGATDEAFADLAPIVVTADRAPGFGGDLVQVGTFRGARLLDVPLTVNVVPSALLRAQDASGLFDALRNTAGVSRAQLNGAAYDNIAIRGILVENRTSYRLNGSLPVINLVDLPIENKDRVEVLKGVAALYYGFSPPSGVVNLVTKRADRDVVELSGTANEYGGVRVAADIGQRFGDRLGVRVNAGAGLVDPGLDRFDGDRIMASLAVDLDVSDRLKLLLDLEHVAKDVTEPAALQLLPESEGRVPRLPRLRTNFGGRRLRYDASATNWLARADWELAASLRLSAEYGEARTTRNRDFAQLQRYGDPGGLGQLRVSPSRDQRYRNRNARLELSSAFLLGPVVNSLILGGVSNDRFQNGRTSPAYSLPQSFVAPVDIVPREPVAFSTNPVDVRDRGLYLSNRASWGWGELLWGLRYSDYRSVTSASGSVRRFRNTRWTPSVSAMLKPSRQMSIYSTYIEGLEEGGTAPAAAANALEVLPPALTRQVELGIKTQHQGATVQLAGFRINRNSAFTDPADNRFKLAGRARFEGIEASISGQVGRFLSLYASGQYLDATIRRSDRAELLGRTPENTPRWTGSVFAELSPDDRSGLGAGLFYVSHRAVDNANSAFVGGYVTVSASARYRFERVGRNGLTLQLNADNLFNERYWSAAGNNLLGVGLPRQVRLTARLAL
jgi:iron complex outermembrane recepter protein